MVSLSTRQKEKHNLLSFAPYLSSGPLFLSFDYFLSSDDYEVSQSDLKKYLSPLSL